MRKTTVTASLGLCLVTFLVPARAQAQALGVFEGHGDVGPVLHAGTASYHAADRTYTVAGSGENMWFAADQFHFVWKKVSGDIALAADISFPEQGGNAHRKAVVMVRQSLEPNSAYADVAVHGDGLTSLQFRDAAGANTHEVQANTSGPRRVRIEKRGDFFYMWTGSGAQLTFTGGSPPIALKDPFYVGIGVCSHEKDRIERAVFSNVQLGAPERSRESYSVLETVPVASTDRRAVLVSKSAISSPAWSADGQSLLFTRDTRPEQVGLTQAAQPSAYEGAALERHVAPPGERSYVSPDGKQVATLSPAVAGGREQIVKLQVRNVEDGKVKDIATFLAGPGALSASPWAPDSKRLTFVSLHRLP